MKTNNAGARRLTLTATFYAIVAVVALAGATQAAQNWLEWPLPAALLAVGALELGGIVLAHHAATRRMLGEAATSARVASAVVALAAVVTNVWGHRASAGQAAFFGVMSALGYATWLIDSESRRRDALRAAGMLAEIPPVYGMGQWLREPRVTRRARVVAQQRAAQRLTDPELPRLDALASLALARREAQQRIRHAAIAKVLHRKIRAAVDRDTADIATAVYDLEQVAERLAAQADYTALTDLIGMDLAPSRLTGTGDLPGEAAQLEMPSASVEVPVDVPAEATQLETPVDVVEVPAEARPKRAPRKAATRTARRPVEVTRAMAREALAEPGTTKVAAAKALGITPRRLRSVLNEPTGEVPVINGHDILASV
jgi:uncharacterized membrane protein YuzA (DUF378 family)